VLNRTAVIINAILKIVTAILTLKPEIIKNKENQRRRGELLNVRIRKTLVIPEIWHAAYWTVKERPDGYVRD